MAGDATLQGDGGVPAPPGLPHLPLADPRQRGLHPRGRRPARAPDRDDRDPARPQGHASSATASAACSPAASPRAVPTWSRASSAWAARCSRRAPIHRVLAWDAEMLARLTRAGFRGMMSADCFGGECARPASRRARLPIDPEVALHRDLQQARRHRRLAGLPRPGRRAGRGAHQPRRHGRRPGRDGPRARRRCATSSSGGPAGRKILPSRWVRSASLTRDRGDLDRARASAAPGTPRRAAAPGPGGRTRRGRRAGPGSPAMNASPAPTVSTNSTGRGRRTHLALLGERGRAVGAVG